VVTWDYLGIESYTGGLVFGKHVFDGFLRVSHGFCLMLFKKLLLKSVFFPNREFLAVFPGKISYISLIYLNCASLDSHLALAQTGLPQLESFIIRSLGKS